MSLFSPDDAAFMARALRLAARGRLTTAPNPAVGCVIVRDGQIMGEGWHREAGGPHAEVVAIEAAGGDVRGTTVYVTLEPCAHHGRTPPCAEMLVAVGVSRVVVAIEDPYDEVQGRGLEMLSAAGIDTAVGLLADVATRLNRGFLTRVRSGRPYVTLKIAASSDGATAMRDGQSQWITGPAARADVQRLRAGSGAILTGIGTVLADDPSLTVRDPAIENDGRQPLRAVVDTRLRMPLSARMLTLPGSTIIYGGDGERTDALRSAGAEVVAIVGDRGRVPLNAVLEDLAARGVNDLLVEAGPTLAGSLLVDGLVDELVIYQAPHIMGSETTGMFTTPGWERLTDRIALDIHDRRRVGSDWRLTARPAKARRRR